MTRISSSRLARRTNIDSGKKSKYDGCTNPMPDHRNQWIAALTAGSAVIGVGIGFLTHATVGQKFSAGVAGAMAGAALGYGWAFLDGIDHYNEYNCDPSGTWIMPGGM